MRELSEIIERAWERLRSYEKTPKELSTVGYKGHVAILKGPYKKVVAEAIKLRLSGAALNRAEAAEEAFDAHLKEATEGEWERTGEVHLDRNAGVARAFCVHLENLLAKSSSSGDDDGEEV